MAEFFVILGFLLTTLLIGQALKSEHVRFAPKTPKVIPPAPKPYKEYETPRRLAAIWHDYEAIDICEKCGMGDAPCLKTYSVDGTTRVLCKWCREWASLTHHLATHGVRRLKQ